MADCAINLKPGEDELVEIAVEMARTAPVFSIDPKVVYYPYSTLGSGTGESVGFSQDAAKIKASHSPVAGEANTFIFPNINAGNIGYKIAQRLGHFEAYGPILQGLNAPINDLSKGCNADEVYTMEIITASLKR